MSGILPERISTSTMSTVLSRTAVEVFGLIGMAVSETVSDDGGTSDYNRDFYYYRDRTQHLSHTTMLSHTIMTHSSHLFSLRNNYFPLLSPPYHTQHLPLYYSYTS